MQNLNRITPQHAVLLDFVDKPAGNPAAVASAKGMMMGSLTSVIEKALPEMYSNKKSLIGYASTSIRWGSQPTSPSAGCRAVRVYLTKELHIWGSHFWLSFLIRKQVKSRQTIIHRIRPPVAPRPLNRVRRVGF
jgi:hypothetical protein